MSFYLTLLLFKHCSPAHSSVSQYNIDSVVTKVAPSLLDVNIYHWMTELLGCILFLLVDVAGCGQLPKTTLRTLEPLDVPL